MKTILIPTDFSPCSENAMQYALAFAATINAKVIIMHVYEVPIFSPEVPSSWVDEEAIRLEEESKIKLDDLSKQLENKYKVEYDILNIRGKAIEQIVDMSRKSIVDLIIMGTKGASGLKEVMIGSNAANVVELSECPVITIPQDITFHKPERILFATDYYDNDLDSIRFLIGLAEPFNAEICVVHFTDGEYRPEFESKFINEFKDLLYKKTTYKNIIFELYQEEDIFKALDDYADQYKADILCMSLKKRTSFNKFFHKSHTRYMACHAKLPLISFHAFDYADIRVG